MRVQGAVSVLDLVGRREMVEKLVAQCEARLAQEHKLAEEEMGGAVGGRGHTRSTSRLTHKLTLSLRTLF